MQPLKDWHLLLFVALFLIIDVVLLSFATSFTTSRLQAVVTSDIEHEDSGVNVRKLRGTISASYMIQTYT